MLYREILKFQTEPNKNVDITDKIIDIVKNCDITDGICHLFLKGTTAGLLLNEDCAMLLGDFKNLFEKVAPADKLYQHPDNAYSHLRASMLKSELSIPVADKNLLLGTWQRIMLMEFDTKKREREIIVTLFL